MLTGALASNNMSNGISFSRAVGIIFLLNEVDQIIYYQSQMDWRVTQATEEGGGEMQNVNPRIEFINKLFPEMFCVFEKINVQRYIYFLICNVSCSLSEVFTFDDNYKK